jgi:transcriptional regulator with XRE-family HTH domain
MTKPKARASGRQLLSDKADGRAAQSHDVRSTSKAVALGDLIRTRRLEYDLPMATVARQMGWDRQRLDNLESGKAVSPDVRAWVLLADRLGFKREYLLALAWEAASRPFPLRLPEPKDPRRKLLLGLLIEQHAWDVPEHP